MSAAVSSHSIRSAVLRIVTKSSSVNGTFQSEVSCTISRQKMCGSFISAAKSMNGDIYLDMLINLLVCEIYPMHLMTYFRYRLCQMRAVGHSKCRENKGSKNV